MALKIDVLAQCIIEDLHMETVGDPVTFLQTSFQSPYRKRGLSILRYFGTVFRGNDPGSASVKPLDEYPMHGDRRVVVEKGEKFSMPKTESELVGSAASPSASLISWFRIFEANAQSRPSKTGCDSMETTFLTSEVRQYFEHAVVGNFTAPQIFGSRKDSRRNPIPQFHVGFVMINTRF